MKALPAFFLAVLLASTASADQVTTFRVETLPSSLAGTWMFRTGHDPAWSSPFRERHAWQPMPVPGCWQRGGAAGYRGHAWYVIRIFIPSGLNDQDLALDLGVVMDAEEVFLNGRSIGTRGAFPPRPVRAVPVPRLYRLPRVSLRFGELNELAVHVYSSAACAGLLGPPPRIVAYPASLRAYVQRDLLLTAVATFLMTLALLQLALFLTPRPDSSHLVFAAFLSFSALFFLTQTHWGPQQLLGQGDVYRLHCAAILGSVAAFIGVLYHYFQLSVPLPLVTAQAALVLGMAFATVWPAPSEVGVLVYLAEGALLLVGVFLLAKTWKQVRLQRSHARPVFASVAILGLCTLVDIAIQIGLLARRSCLWADSFSWLGVIPFALTFTLVFSLRWARLRWGLATDVGPVVMPRERFLRRLEDEMERARRNGAPFSIALLRLSVPDEPARLEALGNLASGALRRTLRQADELASLRADTFAVLLPDADERAAVSTVERLRRVVLDSAPKGSPRPWVTAGVVQFRAGRHQSAQDFLADAEAALYAAAAEGRNATATTP